MMINECRAASYQGINSATHEVCDVPSDGNCLFHAMANQINRKNLMPGQGKQNHKTMRKKAIEEMKANKDHYKPFLFANEIKGVVPTMDQHIATMSRNGEFGDNMEIASIANSCKLPIKLYYPKSMNRDPWTLGEDYKKSDDENKRIELVYVNKNHYREVVSLDIEVKTAEKKEGKGDEKKETKTEGKDGKNVGTKEGKTEEKKEGLWKRMRKKVMKRKK